MFADSFKPLLMGAGSELEGLADGLMRWLFWNTSVAVFF